MTMQRRTFLKNSLAGSAAVAGLSLLPQTLLAAWPENAQTAFKAKSIDEALQALLQKDAVTTTNSNDIQIKSPDIAENGAVVPIEISTTLEKVQSIVLIVEKNPVPLIASFEFPNGKCGGFISTRVKMGATSNIVAVVHADGKLYSNKREVKVTIGGCGG